MWPTLPPTDQERLIQREEYPSLQGRNHEPSRGRCPAETVRSCIQGGLRPDPIRSRESLEAWLYQVAYRAALRTLDLEEAEIAQFDPAILYQRLNNPIED